MQGTISPQPSRPPFWRDERIIGVLTQVLVVAGVALLAWFLYNNMVTQLRAQLGVPITFSFWDDTASFDITGSVGVELLDYTRTSSYGRAFLVGLINTLVVAVVGIILATILGSIVGVARLSPNWLLSKLAAVYVDAFRNVPLLLLLIFWSQAVFQKLPGIQESVILPGPIYINIKGITVPWGTPTESWGTYLWVLLGALGVAVIVGIVLTIQGRRSGRMPLVTLWSFVAFVLVAAVGWFAIPQPLTLTRPELGGFNTTGGYLMRPELLALISGLTIYTAAFIAEIVRAGIQAVSKGQREAATALGLNTGQTLRLIIFPQALRVMIPPMTSQYLNLTKNSSLAIAIGYPDLFSVAGNTIRNQTGRALEVFMVVMGVYLTISLVTSFAMNFYNRRIQLIER